MKKHNGDLTPTCRKSRALPPWIAIGTLLLASKALADTPVPAQTVDLGQTLTVTDPTKITTSGAVVIKPGGTAIFVTGGQISLQPGFKAQEGSSFYAAVDTDHDGIPDSWEAQYGLNPNNASDATADPDADSVSNLVEYRLGTNPTIVQADPSNLTLLKVHRPQ